MATRSLVEAWVGPGTRSVLTEAVLSIEDTPGSASTSTWKVASRYSPGRSVIPVASEGGVPPGPVAYPPPVVPVMST